VALAPSTSIDAFLDAVWLEDGLAENTLMAYRRDLTTFEQWFRTTASKALDDAQAADVQDWFAAQYANTKASTANRRLAALKRYYLWALRQGRVHRDPCLTLQSAKQPARFPKTLSENQVEALLQAPSQESVLGLRDRAMLETLYATGLRVSELVGLNVLDVNLNEGVVRVNMGKGGKDRLVPLGAEALLDRFISDAVARRTAAHPALRCALRHSAGCLHDSAILLVHHQKIRGTRRYSYTTVATRPASRVRHPPAQPRRGSARRANAARARRHIDHTNLYTRRTRAP
jgi:site-specific recombinase XerD